QFFVWCQGALQLCQLLVSSYLRSCISSLELRFALPSATSGLLTSFNEVGNTLLIVLVSYLGSRWHRPRLIGTGALLGALAALLMALPHFMAGPYQYDQSVPSSPCAHVPAGTFSNATDLCQPEVPGAWGNLSGTACPAQAARQDQELLLVMFLAQALLGIGAVPIQPFGISYIDDFASQRNSPLYLAPSSEVPRLEVSTLGLGTQLRALPQLCPLCPPERVQLRRQDPRWVGAWWLGFLLAASLLALAALPYFFFPREMPTEVGEALQSLLGAVRGHQGFPRVLLRTLCQPLFLPVVLAQASLGAMVSGLATFMGKFLERQFSVTASQANVAMGAVNIPGAMVGILLGGAILKRFRLSLRQCSALCLLGTFLCLLLTFPLLFLGCPTQKVAGITYSHSGAGGRQPLACSGHCGCPEEGFNPICGSNQLEFSSPCAAGCSVATASLGTSPGTSPGTHTLSYSNCSCIPGDGTARPGTCGTSCSHLFLPFVALSCLAGIFASTSHTPSCVLLLRSCQPQDKSLAVGIQFMLLRVLAWMPAPVLYGSAIDSCCLLWQRRCARRAACRYYDNDLFRQRYLGLQLLFEAG
ncbi:SO2B1 protein, partial [Eubucco bourcierii]|nr:SO2B1 protein [Eubucco bourcierii]